MKRKAIAKNGETRGKIRTYVRVVGTDTDTRMQPAYDTRYETNEIGNNNGRGRGGKEEREREFGGLRRKKRRRKNGGESKREEEERWVIIGEESGASRSITTWHQANYRLLINMLTASFLLFPSFPLLFYTDRREPQKLQAPSTRHTAYRNCFHKSNKFLVVLYV